MYMSESGVYSITNTVTGKRYIGSTTKFSKRWREHKRNLTLKIHHSVKLQNSWNKHGEAVFKFEVLIECTPDDMLKYEQEYINQFDAVNNGYNVCPVAGNCLGRVTSTETRQKLGEASKRRGQTPETRAKLSALKIAQPLTEAHKAALRGGRGPQEKVRQSKLGNKNPNFGKPRSEETKRKIREANVRAWYTKRGLPLPCERP